MYKKIGWLFLGSVLFCVLLPFGHIALQYYQDNSYAPMQESIGCVDDASHLNCVAGVEVVSLSSDREKTITVLQTVLLRAKEEGKHVSIAGARHSMGGQALSDGIVVDMTGFSAMELQEDGLLHVQSGAKWKDIVPFLHVHNQSVLVMQTNDDFSVGGSLSVNAHGWQFDRGPISSTVQAFDLLLATGEVLHCSRTENQELFGLVLGGYGLFGIILDVWLEVTPNSLLRSIHAHVQLEDFLQSWEKIAQEANIEMLYGRLKIDRDDMFQEALITGYVRTTEDTSVEELRKIPFLELKRSVFRGAQNSNLGKKIRWNLEKWVGGESSGVYTRSMLQHEPASTYANRNPNQTDILHEYFVPTDQVIGFVGDMAGIVNSCQIDVLNVTIRFVKEDRDTLLRYAKEDVFSFVMLFTYDKTTEMDAIMEECTTKLVDNAIAHRGTFYLPYRLHPTKEQFQQAYPQYGKFADAKDQYDPYGILHTRWYMHYVE